MITKEKFEDFKNNDFSMLPMVRELVSPDDNPLSLFEKISFLLKINFLIFVAVGIVFIGTLTLKLLFK